MKYIVSLIMSLVISLLVISCTQNRQQYRTVLQNEDLVRLKCNMNPNGTVDFNYLCPKHFVGAKFNNE